LAAASAVIVTAYVGGRGSISGDGSHNPFLCLEFLASDQFAELGGVEDQLDLLDLVLLGTKNSAKRNVPAGAARSAS
jgi:hypothetical protein